MVFFIFYFYIAIISPLYLTVTGQFNTTRGPTLYVGIFRSSGGGAVPDSVYIFYVCILLLDPKMSDYKYIARPGV